jgi:hypothetical protein
MPRKAELKSVLKLDNLQFVRTIRHSMQMARDLARQFARAPIQTSFVAGLLTAQKSVKVTGRAIEGLSSVAKSVMKGIGIGAVAAAGGIALVAKASIEAASKLEQYETSFSVLLGGMDKAKARMKDLVEFANKTPFQLDEVADASRTLEVFTNGALSTGKGLRMVGDIAAGANRDFGETAVQVGRLFDAIRSGRPAGEALMQLQQVGAIGGNARRKIEGLNQAGMGPEAWQEAEKAFQRFAGMMDKQSATWAGRMSTFKDSITDAMREFGKPLIKNFLPPLELAAKMVFAMAPKFAAAGEAFGKSMREALDFMVGVFSNPHEIVEPLMATLKAGLLGVGNVLAAALKGAVKLVFSKEFFNGLMQAFEGVSKVMGGSMMKALAGPIQSLVAHIEHVMSIGKAAGEAVKENAPNKMFAALGAPGAALAGVMSSVNLVKSLKSKVSSGPSIDDRMKALQKEGFAENLGNETVAEGEREIKTALGTLFDKAASVLEISDVFGAGAELEKAKRSFKRTAVKGAQAIAAANRPVPPPMQMNNWDAWRNRVHSFGTTMRSGLSTSGLRSGGMSTSGLNAPAQRTTSLLALQERRQFENEMVAGQMAAGIKNARKGSVAGAFGAVRRGDKERMREVQKEKLREKSGLDKTNSILEAIQVRFDQLVK